MDVKLLISKIAIDKDSKKLGKIIRIEQLPGKTIKKDIPYAMILFSKPFKKDIIVPLEAVKLLKYDTQYAWFNITKEEFDKEIEQLKKEKLDREYYRGSTTVKPSRGLGWNFDPYNLGHRQKERKK